MVMDIVKVKKGLEINQPSAGLSSLELVCKLTSRCSNVCQRYLAGFCHVCLYRYGGHMTGLIMDLKALPLQNMCKKSRKVGLQEEYLRKKLQLHWHSWKSNTCLSSEVL